MFVDLQEGILSEFAERQRSGWSQIEDADGEAAGFHWSFHGHTREKKTAAHYRAFRARLAPDDKAAYNLAGKLRKQASRARLKETRHHRLERDR